MAFVTSTVFALESSAYDKDFLLSCHNVLTNLIWPDIYVPKLVGQCVSAEQKIGAIILYEVPFSERTGKWTHKRTGKNLSEMLFWP